MVARRSGRRSHLNSATDRPRLSSVDRLRDPLGDHDRRGVQRHRYNDRHDRCVDDTKSVDSPDGAMRVHDRPRVLGTAHRRGARLGARRKPGSKRSRLRAGRPRLRRRAGSRARGTERAPDCVRSCGPASPLRASGARPVSSARKLQSISGCSRGSRLRRVTVPRESGLTTATLSAIAPPVGLYSGGMRCVTAMCMSSSSPRASLDCLHRKAPTAGRMSSASVFSA